MLEHPRNMYAVIYGRVSTTSDEQGNSLSVQTIDNNDFSFFSEFKNKYGYKTYAIYSDDTSGTTHNRKGFQELLTFLGIERKEVITNKKLPSGNKKINRHYVYDINEDTLRHIKNDLNINYILCKNTSRWTRGGDFELIQILRNNQIYIYFHDENIDTFNVDSDVLLGIIQQLDKNKSTDISKKVRSGYEASIKLKKVRTNSFIYGFELIPNDSITSSYLKAVEGEKEVIQEIFKLYTGFYIDDNKKPIYYGSRQIANILKERGITTRIKETKKGKIFGGIPFSVSSIKHIINNEKYAGYVNTELKWDSGAVFNKNSPRRIYDYKIEKCDYIEPIVDIETFLKAQEICKSRSDEISKRGRYTGNSVYFHKIKCKRCGAWYSQNGEINAKGEYIKKMNCSNKKKNGLSACNNSNVSFIEIDRRYAELRDDFSNWLKYEILMKKRMITKYLISVFEYYFENNEEKINSIKEKIKDIDNAYDTLILQRIGLPIHAAMMLNERLENLSIEKYNLQEELEEIFKYTERIRPYIDKLIDALNFLKNIDINKAYTIEEIKNFDIIMYIDGNSYYFEMQLLDLDAYHIHFKAITSDLVFVRDNLEDNEINGILRQYYKEYDVLDKAVYI